MAAVPIASGSICILTRGAPCYHAVQAWEDGGYSDDLTVASKCTELQLPIYCPGYAIFPQWCASGFSWLFDCHC